MRKGEKVSNNTQRKKQTTTLWMEIIKEYTTDNIPPPEIARKHINPQTKKPYTTRHVYFILRTMNVI